MDSFLSKNKKCSMNNRIIKTFEEFVQIEIEDSDVHLHFNDEEETETEQHGDEVIVDIPMMKLNKVGGEEKHHGRVQDLDKDEYDEMESEDEKDSEEENEEDEYEEEHEEE